MREWCIPEVGADLTHGAALPQSSDQDEPTGVFIAQQVRVSNEGLLHGQRGPEVRWHRLRAAEFRGRKAGSENAPTEGFEMNNLFLNVYIKFQILMDREDGQDMVEYALIVASLALAAVAGMKGLAGGLNTAYINLSAKLGSTIM